MTYWMKMSFVSWKTSVFGNNHFAKKKCSLFQNNNAILILFPGRKTRAVQKRHTRDFQPRKDCTLQLPRSSYLESPLPFPQTVCTNGRPLVLWRHNQVFSPWWFKPKFLINGAPLARFAHWSSAINHSVHGVQLRNFKFSNPVNER